MYINGSRTEIIVYFSKENNMSEEKILKLSVSSIGSYEKCPKQFWYRYIEKVKVEKAPNIATEFGSLMHLILELFHKDVSENNLSVKDFGKSMTTSVKLALKEFDLALIKQPVWTPSGNVNGLDYMVSLCKEYLQKVKDEGLPNVIGLEEPYEFYHKGVHMRGYIDRVDEVEDGVYKVVDYKTSKNTRYLKDFQILVYASAIKNKYKNVKKILGSFMMMKHGYEEKYVEIDDQRIDDAIKKIEDVAEMIKTDTVWEKKPTFLCNWCDYKDLCQNSWV